MKYGVIKQCSVACRRPYVPAIRNVYVPQNLITVCRTASCVTVTDLHICTNHFTVNPKLNS